MKAKQKIKMIVDLIMTLLLLSLMAYTHTGQEVHEWLGVGMFVFFIIHNVLNRVWYTTLCKGKYNPYRIFTVAVNFLIFFIMILLMISGMSMSNHIFTFLDVRLAASLARKMHMAASYWGFALMSVHLGIHWGMIMKVFKKLFKITTENKILKMVSKALTFGILAIGILMMIKHDIVSYMFLTTEFVFFDYTQTKVMFFIEYFIILAMYTCIGYYIAKNIKKISSKTTKVISVFILCITLLGCTSATKIPEERAQFFALDTDINLTAYGENAKKAIELAKKRVEELDAMWSVTNPNSDISQINRSVGLAIEVNEETIDILQYAIEISKRTDGIFDPTIYPIVKKWGFTTHNYRIPTNDELIDSLTYVDYNKIKIDGNIVTVPMDVALDLGAIGKGFISYYIAEIFDELNVESGLIDLGGNIEVIGKKTDGTDWNIGINDSYENGNIGILTISDKAIVTSGGYERYFIGEDGKEYIHIIDPFTGYPAVSDVVSVSVIGEDARLCDALSTPLFIMGVEQIVSFYQNNEDFDFIAITVDKKVYISKGIVNQFEINAMYESMEVVVIER